MSYFTGVRYSLFVVRYSPDFPDSLNSVRGKFCSVRNFRVSNRQTDEKFQANRNISFTTSQSDKINRLFQTSVLFYSRVNQILYSSFRSLSFLHFFPAGLSDSLQMLSAGNFLKQFLNVCWFPFRLDRFCKRFYHAFFAAFAS